MYSEILLRNYSYKVDLDVNWPSLVGWLGPVGTMVIENRGNNSNLEFQFQ